MWLNVKRNWIARTTRARRAPSRIFDRNQCIFPSLRTPVAARGARAGACCLGPWPPWGAGVKDSRGGNCGKKGRLILPSSLHRRWPDNRIKYSRRVELPPTGHLDVEDRSTPGRVSEARLATEPIDDLFDDAQAKPGAASLPGVRCIGLRESLEDVRLEIS